MKKYMPLGLSIVLISVLLIGIFNFSQILYNTEKVTSEVKDYTEDFLSGEDKGDLKEAKKEDLIDSEFEVADKDESEDKVDTIVVEKEPEDKGKDGVENNEKEEKDPVSDSGSKIAYLTFDDGPSVEVTPAILKILNEYDIKATFFVVGNQAEKNPEVLLQVAEEGHLIGNHSYSHDYKYIYKNTNNFLYDMNKARDILEDILDDKFDPSLIRFPGGSFGDKKASARKAALENGYKYVDWNVLNGDAEGLNLSVDKLVARLKETLRSQKSAVILMHDHDAKQTTADALPEIIEYLQAEGYEFKTLADFDYKY